MFLILFQKDSNIIKYNECFLNSILQVTVDEMKTVITESEMRKAINQLNHGLRRWPDKVCNAIFLATGMITVTLLL